jgi:hypothetical protein
MRSAAPTHLQSTRLTVRFDASLGIPDRNNNLWNRTWIKAGAISIAVALADQTIPLAARWQVGLGSVAAFAFSPTVAEATTLAKQIAAPPRDPRFKVTWQCDSTISVSVNASTESDYLNGLHFVLNLGDQSPGALKQTEPGRYSLEIPASRSPTLATIQFDGHVIDRRSIAGRYAPEFDAIGNDDAALEQLASRTGGQVIAPNQHTPITFRWPLKFVRIDSYLAGAGAILVGACLVLSPFSRPAVSAVSRS